MKTFIITLFLSITTLFYSQSSTYVPQYGVKMVTQHAFYGGNQSLVRSNMKARNFTYEFNTLVHRKRFNHGGGYYITGGFKNRQDIKMEGEKYTANYDDPPEQITAQGMYGFGGAGIYYKINKYFIGNYFDGGLFTDLGLRVGGHLVSSDIEYPSGYGNVSSTANKTNPDLIALSYTNTVALTKFLFVEMKVGYSLPLNKVNISPFITVQKSLLNMVSETGTFNSPDAGIVSFQFGVSMTILRPNTRYL